MHHFGITYPQTQYMTHWLDPVIAHTDEVYFPSPKKEISRSIEDKSNPIFCT